MIPHRPDRRPKVGDALTIAQAGHTYQADVDHLTGQYVHVAQLRFHVLDDWLNSHHGWRAQPGNAFITFPAS